MNHQELTELYNFKDRTVIVTGGAGVLGSEMACALVGCGANVVILDRDMRLAERLIHRFEPLAGGRALAVYGDVLNRESLEQARDSVQHEFGRVDGLINGAGGNKPEASTTPDRSLLRFAGGSAALRVRSEFDGHHSAVTDFWPADGAARRRRDP